jgi:hypothetical protein
MSTCMLLRMSTNYFGGGLQARLGEFKLKYEAFEKDARISEETVCRAIKGEQLDEATKLRGGATRQV